MITCYLTANLPRTGGSVRVGVPCQTSKRALKDGVQELITLYHRYPVAGAKLHLTKDDQVIATGNLIEGPKQTKRDEPDLFVQGSDKTYRLSDWLEKVIQA